MTIHSISFKGTSKLSKRKRYHPMDPVEIARIAAEARRNPEKWGLNHEALALPANEDVIAEGAGQRNTSRASRYNCFALLLARGSLEPKHLMALNRLCDAIAARYKTEGSGGSGEKVDGGLPDFEGNVDRRMENGDLLDDIIELTGVASSRLLLSILIPQVTRGIVVKNWRDVAASQLQDQDHKRQTGHIRAACDNLVEALIVIDKRKPRRRRSITGAEIAA